MKKSKLARLIAAICCFAMLLTACNSNQTPAGSGGDVSTMADSEKKVLTYAIGAETTDLSTLYMNNSLCCTSKLVYENLVDFDNGEIVPGLAESWEYNDDQTELTFHLRQGITFHNGEPFNAEAVKTNLEHKQSNPSFYTLKGITDITEMEIVDDYTITLHYDHPFYAYLQDFCWSDVCPMSAPEFIIPDDFQTISGVAGTGPYIYDEYVAGEYTRFVRNEDYWGEKPYWDEIIVKYIPDSTSRLQALQTGEIDMIYGASLLSYEEYDQALAMDGIAGQMADKDTRVQIITTNATRPYMSDLRVRQAVAYAIDKEELSQATSNGYEPAADMLFLQMSDVCAQTFLVNGAELFQKNERGQFQPVFRLEKIVSGQLGLGVHFAGYGRHNDGGAVFVPRVVLKNKDGAIAFLLGADSPAQIGIVHIAAQICPVHVL